MRNFMLHHSTSFQFLNGVPHSRKLGKFYPGLPIPLNLLMNLGRGISDYKVLPVFDFLMMWFQQVPQFLLHDTALGMQRAQVNDQGLQNIAIPSG